MKMPSPNERLGKNTKCLVVVASKGMSPVGWKAELPNGQVVYANQAKRGMESFIFEYRYDQGEVILKDFDATDPEADKPI